MAGMICTLDDTGECMRGRSIAGRILYVLALSLALSACAAPTPPENPVVSRLAEPGPGVRPTDLPASQLTSLDNLSAPELLARLGPPDFTRRDPPAELWQYRGATCVLDLFLYPDAGTLKVSHTQTRGRHGTQAIGLGANSCSPFSPETTASTS
jgi:hypothetical protein